MFYTPTLLLLFSSSLSDSARARASAKSSCSRAVGGLLASLLDWDEL